MSELDHKGKLIPISIDLQDCNILGKCFVKQKFVNRFGVPISFNVKPQLAFQSSRTLVTEM